MYRTIVVGTDGSPTAALARATAIDLAARFGARLVVVTAFDPPRLTEGVVRNVALQAVGAAEARGVTATPWIQRGSPEDVILAAAEGEKADLVVVGNKGMAEGTRFRLGGVPDRVAHHASTDVWIVATTQAAVPALAQARRYRHILVGTDGSPTANEAVRKAFELAAVQDAILTLVHVGDPITGTIHLEAAARGGPAGVDVRLAPIQGSPAEVICELAEREGVDLIVVGNRGISGARRYLLGSVPSRIARAAPTDVLIARTVDLSVFDVEPGHGAVVDLDGRKMAVYRDPDGQIRAVSARCTHLGCTVAWNDGEETWDCPCHGSRYDKLGHVIRGPAPADLEGAPPLAAKDEAPARAASASRHSETFVIVGASVAGGSAAIRLRDEGFDGRLLLIGAENHYPYERPPLSKAFLRGEEPFEDSLVKPVEWYRENRVEMRLATRATALDPKERTVTLEGGEAIRFDGCLIATGARNRRLPIPGLDLAGVHQLRSVREAEAIREEIIPGRRVVVVGMGFIGSEVAASLRQTGVEVTTIDGGKVPLGRVLGEEIGGVLGEVHREHGVTSHFGQVVAAFEGDTRVRRVVTKDGLVLECDFVVVGMGVQPNTELAEAAGLRVENGIVVDELCSAGDGIYAAGDVASYFHPVFGVHIRTEHWNNAIQQGEAAANSMLGGTEPYTDLPWFWSDQYEHNVQYTGFHMDWDELVFRGRTEDRRFVAFYLKEGRVQSLLAMNQGDAVGDAADLITSGTVVEREVLADPGVDLRSLAAGPGRKVGESGGR